MKTFAQGTWRNLGAFVRKEPKFMEKERSAQPDRRKQCEMCGKKLTEENCTMITSFCDDCLVDMAEQDRQAEAS